MVKILKSKVDQKAIPEIELVDDAWPRFEALVKSAAKMGHKPHDAKPTKVRKRSISTARQSER